MTSKDDRKQILRQISNRAAEKLLDKVGCDFMDEDFLSDDIYFLLKRFFLYENGEYGPKGEMDYHDYLERKLNSSYINLDMSFRIGSKLRTLFYSYSEYFVFALQEKHRKLSYFDPNDVIFYQIRDSIVAQIVDQFVVENTEFSLKDFFRLSDSEILRVLA